MRAESLVRGTHHHAKPLVIRGGLARTFGSLSSFLALILLLLGFYLLRDAFLNPLDAQPVGILAAALGIALSVIMFYFLFKPRPRHGHHPRTTRFRRAE
ncbi:MAG: hypothetical protein WBE13_14885 [Candidatus Acidiferrum sp.]